MIAAATVAELLVRDEALRAGDAGNGAASRPPRGRLGLHPVDADTETPDPRTEFRRPDGRADARGDRHHQGFRHAPRQRQHRLRHPARRDPRAPRRERRRQVDAGQDPLRRAAADRGRDPLAAASRSTIPNPGRGPPARHRHGVPALLAVRCADRRREHRARACRAHAASPACKTRISKVSAEYGLPLNPDSVVADLSVGERQRVEIVRCLLQEPQLIIMDEPTSVLTPQEADDLFVTLKRLAVGGLLRPLHQPPARGGARDLPPRHHPPPRQGGRRVRPAEGDRRRGSRA